MQMWADNISKIKRVTKSWAKAFRAKQQLLLKSTEIEISEIYKNNSTSVLLVSEMESLKNLELKRHNLLL